MGRVSWRSRGDFRRAAPEASGSLRPGAGRGGGRRAATPPAARPWRPGPAGACGPKGGSARARPPARGFGRQTAAPRRAAPEAPRRLGSGAVLTAALTDLGCASFGLGARPADASRSAVASPKPAALGWADDRNGKGAHGVGAAQGQVSLGQHVGRVSQQAQPPPGARQCGPLQPARSQMCVASSRGQQPPASESPARGRCGPRFSELSPPPHLLFLFVVLSLFGLRCG